MSDKSEKSDKSEDHQSTRVAVLGYGAEGRAHALKLRSAGYDVAVAVRPGGMSWIRAMEDGFRPFSHGEAVKGADIVAMLVPEAEQPALYSSCVAPHIKPGALLVFTRGASVHARALETDPSVDVVLVTARSTEPGSPKKCFVAVHTDATGSSCSRAIDYARAAFGDDARMVATTTFADEVATDLSHQARNAGGVPELLAAMDERLSSTGYEPDEAQLAYYERLKDICADSVARLPSPPSSASPLSQTASPPPASPESSADWDEFLKKSQRRGVA